MPTNPFKPTIGATPPALVGRDPIIDDIRDSLGQGPGAPGRTAIFTGARGVGKTVMLNVVEKVALERRWPYISETATSGLLNRLDEHLEDLLGQLTGQERRRVTGITLPAGLGGITTQLPKEEGPATTRRRLTLVTDILAANGSGLMITLDEVHHGARAELRELGALHQHMVREDREIALMMAGLPSAISSLLSESVLTFLRRADKHLLLDVPIEDVQESFIDTIRGAGRGISEADALLAAEATGGYPFLIQLVGYHLWRLAKGPDIDSEAVQKGIIAAQRRLGALVHEPALNDLSAVDRTFLAAMSRDQGPSKMRDIIDRMGTVTPSYANTYKQRLIEAGMIQQAGYGRVDYALPYLRDYLREHAAALGIDSQIDNQAGGNP